MSDFYQNGIITTLHNLRLRSISDFESKLFKFSGNNPICIALPCLYSELHGKALPKIMKELSQVQYIQEIIIGLDKADYREYKKAHGYFSRLPQHCRLLWLHNPELISLEKEFFGEESNIQHYGKGRNVWYLFGYFLASNRSKTLILHDCDIITYHRFLLARLVYPVIDPGINYKFCKGYYFRSDSEKFNGRLTRLLVTPLIRALQNIFPSNQFLSFFNSFRYPLAGEFAVSADIVNLMQITGNWGLETSILAEVFRLVPSSNICQVDIADRYDHKHRELSQVNPGSGLSQMSIDIVKTIFIQLIANGSILTFDTCDLICDVYRSIAFDLIIKYQHDAKLNGLIYNKNEERQMIDIFAKNIYNSGIDCVSGKTGNIFFFPSWEKVNERSEYFLANLYNIIESDNIQTACSF
ncbi:MAG: glycosyl transferase [Chitinispirillia bacterium]|jgi:glucosyl-3-phosphoglycerate synthase